MIIHFGRCCLSTASDAMNQVQTVEAASEEGGLQADGEVSKGKKAV